ncbi:hypothetical protein J569_1474 [Acinetobacter sp. 907131]|nr:hypothetical protein J569_1474 [Acinetobacter sp. 907131]EXS15634.1 hypothetical protein J672_2107 [Acinetobacter sp. 883425]
MSDSVARYSPLDQTKKFEHFQKKHYCKSVEFQPKLPTLL